MQAIETADCEISCNNLYLEIKQGKKEPPQTILHDVSLKIKSGELVVMMGSSGAGKTTLLNAFCGYLPKNCNVYGEIMLNGAPRDPVIFPSLYGYVRQFERFYENLTVLETLTFAANMKMKRRGMTNEETILLKKERIANIMSYLGLTDCMDRKMCTISGGERRRVSIALEIITDPPILFLDEPTSGLDAFTSFTIIELLRDIAKIQKKTILLTIHQPKFDMLEMFDRVVLLCKGRIVYDGGVNAAIPYFSRLGYPVPANANPFDYYIELITMDNRTVEREQKSKEIISFLTRKWQEKERTEHTIHSSYKREPPMCDEKNAPFFVQIYYLTRRLWKDMSRDKPFLIGLAVQFVMLIVLFGLVFLQLGNSQQSIQSRFGVLFYSVAFVMYACSTPILGGFPLEMITIRRERSSRYYGGVAVYLAKIISLLPSTILVFVGSACAVYWIVGLFPSMTRFLVFLLIVFSVIFFTIVFCLFIAALAPNQQASQVIGPSILLVFVIFAGNFANVDTIPGFLRWLIWISPDQYAFKAAVQNEFYGLTFDCPPNNTACFTTGEQVVENAGLQSPSKFISLLLLWVIIIVFFILGAVAVELRSRPQILLKITGKKPPAQKTTEEVDEEEKLIRPPPPTHEITDALDTIVEIEESSKESTPISEEESGKEVPIDLSEIVFQPSTFGETSSLLSDEEKSEA